MTIRIGFVGLSKSSGWAKGSHVSALLSEPLKSQYTLSALSTSTPTSASENAAHFSALVGNDVRAYHGPTDAIADDKALDLVAVAVRSTAHRDAVLPILERGRNIFVEWPAGKNIAETREFATKAKEKGVRTMVGLQGWQTPALKKIREVIAAGMIGTVTNVTWIGLKPPAGAAWTPFVNPSTEITIDPAAGSTLADIWIGHNFADIVRGVGPLESISATGVIAIPKIKVGESRTDPDAKYVPAQVPDQYSVSGVLAGSGALFTGNWRTLGLDATNTGPTFIWLIDGSKGQLRIEVGAETSGGSFPMIYYPTAVFVNGEKVSLEEENKRLGGNIARAYAEYARGAEGEYPNFDDALVVKQHLEAIKKSVAAGGAKVIVSEM